ncbi:MAG: alkaline phosphatase D family protein [Zoogloea sp.]|uniref:alkaline phosphatase D family protein n=1 Tax=Zoogloea sp. TaxID=49181 RepID=UPI003F308F76
MKRKNRLILAASAALLTGLGSLSAEAAKISAGPMVGITALRAAKVWLQGDGVAKARLEYWPTSQPELKRLTEPLELNKGEDFTARFEVTDLAPGVKYQYRVLLDGKAASETLSFATQSLWQWRKDPPEFNVLFGSCAYINEPEYDRPGTPYGGGTQIFRAMAEAKPDLTLWLGDNLYFREVDYDSPSGMAARYRHDRATADLQPLLKTGSHAAIWDDHDYGPNDSNSSFMFKEQALTLFKRYWANASYGQPDQPGVFTQLPFGDAEFFMLDNRWYRDADNLVADDKVMFGKGQMRWLKNALLASTATFKFIVGGSQMLDNTSPYEGWLNFRNERQEFLDWLSRQKVDGVVFLSGDRHHTELLKVERTGAYPLYELTCSPFTAGTHDIKGEMANPGLVPGTLVGERNYCSLQFSGPRGQRKLLMQSFNETGKALWKHEIPATGLSYGKKSAP